VRAVKAGALDFLEKPAEGRLVLERVTAALAADSERRREAARRASARARWEDLTPREQEIAPLLAHGHSNKEIARALGISHRTVEVHRARIMHKLGVKAAFDVAEILRACGLLPPPGDPSRRPLER
jgi:FixJ family two-component response regulator